MSPDEIQAVAKVVAEAIAQSSGGSAQWIGYLVAIIFGGLFSFGGSYLAEKAKGRATKEDIQDITKRVEEVKSEYVRQIEDFKAHHQLRMLAAEKRLEAHQSAYYFSDRLFDSVANDTIKDFYAAIDDGYSWYNKNCIFLTQKSRDVFLQLLRRLPDLRIQVAEAGGKDFNYNQMVDTWTFIRDAGNVFLGEIELPAMKLNYPAEAN